MLNRLDDVVDGVDEQSGVLVIDLLDGNLDVLFIGVAVLKLVGIFEGVLEELVDKSHPLFPISFKSIAFVHFLELGKVVDKVFLGDGLVEDCLLELVIFNLNPEIVFALD